MRRREFFDTIDHRVRRRHVVKAKKTIQRIDVDPPLYRRVLENRLDLGAKKNVAAQPVEKERLDADAITCQHETFSRVRPKAQREHSTKPPETIRVPLAKRMQHHFGVAARSKSTPAGDELRAKLGVIVDLAVKDENQVAVLTDHRLIAVEQIDDLQAHRSQ